MHVVKIFIQLLLNYKILINYMLNAYKKLFSSTFFFKQENNYNKNLILTKLLLLIVVVIVSKILMISININFNFIILTSFYVKNNQILVGIKKWEY